MDNDHPNNPAAVSPSGSGISISSESASYLKEVAKWSSFLSIVGFCIIGIMVIFALFAGTVFSSFDQYSQTPLPVSGFLFSLLYLLMSLLYFFPVLYLFNFSRNLKTALAQTDPSALEEAFRNLKAHYKYVGILTIIVLTLYLVLFLGVLLFGAALGSAM